MPTRITAANIVPGSITADRLGGDLSSISGGPKITIISILDESNTVLDDTAVALSGGRIRLTGSGFAAGCVVIVGTTDASSTTFISSNFVDAVVPGLSAGTYPVYVVNPDGGTGIRIRGLIYSSTPTWVTGSTLANQTVDSPLSIQLLATSDSTITYSLSADSILPPGVTLSSSGLLSGTVTGIENLTVYSFTVVATDQELQDTSRIFNMTVAPIPTNNYGWFGGGNPITSIVNRITFASDTETASVRGPLTPTKAQHSATGNNNFGWFGGGVPGPQSEICRITYASDTVAATLRGNLNVPRNFPSATGNANFGWFAGDISQISRITYASDSSNAVYRGQLSQSKQKMAATGNANFGWFSGGGIPGLPPGLSTVERITYASDTNTASARGPMGETITEQAATGNDDFGWFGGGAQGPGPRSMVFRITYASDTNTASARGPLAIAKNRKAAVGNRNFGWYAGGVPAYNLIDRITWVTDTVAAVQRGSMTANRFDFDATGGIL